MKRVRIRSLSGLLAMIGGIILLSAQKQPLNTNKSHAVFNQPKAMLTPFRRVAMQYSPNNLIFHVSMVDAGTVELIRGFPPVAAKAPLVPKAFFD